MSKEQLRNLLYVSIISADNDNYTEEVKQQIIDNFHTTNKSISTLDSSDWRFILSPIEDDNIIDKYIELLS